MLMFLFAINVLVAAALAATFPARSIVIAAPILLVFTATALWTKNFDPVAIVIWTCACLVAAQAAFLTVSFISHKWSTKPRPVSTQPPANRADELARYPE
jgi:hypothetical protein